MMQRGRSAINRPPDASGYSPNRVVIVGDGPDAQLIRSLLPAAWTLASIEADKERVEAEILIEAVGESRHVQLAVLRHLSAIAPDEAVIIATSPTLSLGEIARSVTGPHRLIRMVALWAERTGVCEIITTVESGEAAVRAATGLAAGGRRRVIHEREGVSGPTALTRLLGAVVICAWNLALRTGRPCAVDRLAQAEGLSWRPLRELDRFGLQRAAGLFDRRPQIGKLEAVYRSAASEEASPPFAAKCGTDLIEEVAPIGYFIAGAVEAGLSLLRDGVVDSRSFRGLVLTAFGPGFASEVLRGLSGRYPDSAGRSARAMPTGTGRRT